MNKLMTTAIFVLGCTVIATVPQLSTAAGTYVDKDCKDGKGISGRKAATIRATKSGVKLTKVNAKITRQNIKKGTGTTGSSRKYVQNVGCPSDDAGHAVARALGGKGGSTSNNIFPQNPNANRGVFEKFERSVRYALCTKDEDTDQYVNEYADVKITFNYSNKTHPNRPDQVHYRATMRKASGEAGKKGGQSIASQSFYNRTHAGCDNVSDTGRDAETMKQLVRDSNKVIKTSKDLRKNGSKAEVRLIDYVCELDTETPRDANERKIDSAADKMKGLESKYFKILRAFDVTTDDIEELLSSESSSVKTKAKNQLKKIDSERNLLEAMGSTLLQGDEYPDIEENVAYMHLMHENMHKAGKYACVKGKPSSAGAADCISVKHCTVWEFGPSSASRSTLLKAASDAIDDVNDAYENEESAKECYPKGFVAKVATYKACTPRSHTWGK